MKRYKKLITIIPIDEDESHHQKIIRTANYVWSEVNNEMREHPEGEWVKYEDVKHLRQTRISEIYEERIRELKECNDRAFDNGVEAARHRGIGNDPKTHLQPGITYEDIKRIEKIGLPECNCAEAVLWDRIRCKDPNQTWLCPAHGYKKR